jgi:hypothetical protein
MKISICQYLDSSQVGKLLRSLYKLSNGAGLTETSSSDLSSLEKRFPQYQHSREPIAQLENASPSSEITTSFADDETAGMEQGWIGASSAYEYA